MVDSVECFFTLKVNSNFHNSQSRGKVMWWSAYLSRLYGLWVQRPQWRLQWSLQWRLNGLWGRQLWLKDKFNAYCILQYVNALSRTLLWPYISLSLVLIWYNLFCLNFEIVVSIRAVKKCRKTWLTPHQLIYTFHIIYGFLFWKDQ